MAESKIKNFRRLVWRYYRTHGRYDLPWRPPSLKLRRDKSLDMYRVLVSEIMLQQTQVDRVIPFYKKFIKTFPTPVRLASASLASVLRLWQGLGYNRRAKMLHAAAKELATRFPRFDLGIRDVRSNLLNSNLVAELEKLPGVGPYTARAVAAFAYNQDVVVIETNIRTAIIHHFFSTALERKGMIYHTGGRKVSDTEIEKILMRALPKDRAREWYSALMDYGAHLKQSGMSHNAWSKTYTKQSKFVGSNREARGTILRALAQHQNSFGAGLASQGDSSPRGVTLRNVFNLLDPSRRSQLRAALAALEKEGLITKKGRIYTLAN